MADSAKSAGGPFVREIELRGHILDSGVFGRVLEIIMDNEFARYTIDNFNVGKTATESSTARLRIEADNEAALIELLDKLRDVGAIVADDTDAETEAAPRDGVLPEEFYATTNLQTEVRVNGRWLRAALPEMDCAIVVDAGAARTVAPSDVRKGERVVVGHSGVRVQALNRARRRQVFEFMSSTVSSEKPKESLLIEIARELVATHAEGKRVLLVGGPAIVHTGAGKYLERLIRHDYVDALFAGNALALHDIESQFFGTSLGVDLSDAFPVEEGHVHHLRPATPGARSVGSRPGSMRGFCTAASCTKPIRRRFRSSWRARSATTARSRTSSPTSSRRNARCASTFRRSGWRSWSGRCCTRSPSVICCRPRARSSASTSTRPA